MSYEMIAFLMFASMMLLLFSGQRVFGAIGVVGVCVNRIGTEFSMRYSDDPAFQAFLKLERETLDHD